jgi:hypothetical protein
VLLFAGSFVLASLQLVSAFVISQRRRAGWVVSMLCCALAVPYDLLTHQPGFVVTCCVSFVIGFRAYRIWGLK